MPWLSKILTILIVESLLMEWGFFLFYIIINHIDCPSETVGVHNEKLIIPYLFKTTFLCASFEFVVELLIIV